MILINNQIPDVFFFHYNGPKDIYIRGEGKSASLFNRSLNMNLSHTKLSLSV